MEQVCDSIATFFYSKTQKKRVGTYESILSQLVIKGQFFGQFVKLISNALHFVYVLCLYR